MASCNNIQTRQTCLCLSNKTPPVSCLNLPHFFRTTWPIFPSSPRFMGSKMGVSPSITSNISVSNLMHRCEWILKQAGEAPGEVCAEPPGPAAGLNKYTSEQTCRQLGPDMAIAVCVVALQGSGTVARFLGEREEEKNPHEENKWHLKTCCKPLRVWAGYGSWWFQCQLSHPCSGHRLTPGPAVIVVTLKS